jgi:phosphohistidine phosphatase
MLMRHGKSDWSVDATDFDRPLTNRGKRDARRMGNYLEASGLVPGVVVSSPARRAIETAKRCIRAAGSSTECIVEDERIYHAGVGVLADVLADYRDRDELVMFVGHNPGMEQLLEALVDSRLPRTDKGKLLTTANVAIVNHESRLLERLVRPSDLPSLKE